MQSNKGIWIIVGIFVATILIAGYFLVGPGKPSPRTTPQPLTKVDENFQTFAPPGSEVEEEASNKADIAREVKVKGNEFSFSPQTLTVNKGEKIRMTFENKGSLSHDLTIDELGVSTATVIVGQEDTIEFTVEDVGTYTFYCSIGNHKELGMEGELIVE